MTTEHSHSDASRAAERRALSRRELIKASAVAGAAAWTAPVIVDSLASPAAAVSGACNKKYLKLTTGYGTYGGCCNLNPSCGSGYTSANSRDSGEANLCSNSGCGGASSNSLAATLASSGTYANYYKVTLPGTCRFQPSSFTNSWQVVGNTAVNGTCTNLSSQATDTGVPASGSGYFVNGGTVAYISKTAAADFIYLQYCCSS